MSRAGSKASGSGQAQRSGMDEPDAFQAAAEASGGGAGGPVSSGGGRQQQPTSSGEQAARGRSKKSQRKSHGQGAAADATTPAAMASPPPAAPAAASAEAAAPSSSLLDESDPFFSSYAALEMRITQCSHLLAQILRTLKHIKAYPHDATRYTQSISDQLETTGASLAELYTMQQHFNALPTPAGLNAEEKSRRVSVRAQANSDIAQMRQSHALISAAALQRTGQLPMSRSTSRNGLNSERERKEQGRDTDRGRGRSSGRREQGRGDGDEEQGYGRSEEEDENALRQSLVAAARDGGGGLSGLGGDDGRSSSTAAASSFSSSSSVSLQLPSTFQRQGSVEEVGDLEGHATMLATAEAARLDFMQQLSRDVAQVGDLFQDVQYLVTQQAAMIDVIDDNIAAGHSNASQAETQVRRAREYQKARRRKLCCLAFLALVMLALAFLFIWVAFGDTNF